MTIDKILLSCVVDILRKHSNLVLPWISASWSNHSWMHDASRRIMCNQFPIQGGGGERLCRYIHTCWIWKVGIIWNACWRINCTLEVLTSRVTMISTKRKLIWILWFDLFMLHVKSWTSSELKYSQFVARDRDLWMVNIEMSLRQLSMLEFSFQSVRKGRKVLWRSHSHTYLISVIFLPFLSYSEDKVINICIYIFAWSIYLILYILTIWLID